MSTQFKNVRAQTSGIRAWGDMENGHVVVELRIVAGKNKKDKSKDGLIVSESSESSNVHIGDVYQKQDGKWLAQFGTIKSMTGLSNKQIPDILNRLQELGKFSTSSQKAQWENICISDGKVIFTDDLKNEKPKMWIVEDKPFADAVRKLEKIDLSQVTRVEEKNVPEAYETEKSEKATDVKPNEDQDLDTWLDDIIEIISEIADATPEQLQKLGQSLNLIGKELEDSGLDEEIDSLVESIESDDEDEMIEQCIQEMEKGNKPLIKFFADLADKSESESESTQKPGVGKLCMEEVMKKQKEFFETPVKPNESLIANKIMQEAAEKISKTCPVNEQQRHTDAIVDMVQKMQLMSTEDIEKLWDMWTLRQERLANQNKPRIIPKKSKPEPELSDNDWKEIDESWEEDEKKYWEELKELEKIEERLEHTPPSKSWGPNREAVSPGSQEMTTQEIDKGCKRQKNFLDRILDEIVFCEPMGWEETQRRWEKTWKDMRKEWQRFAMNRRHKEQEESSRRDLFLGIIG